MGGRVVVAVRDARTGSQQDGRDTSDAQGGAPSGRGAARQRPLRHSQALADSSSGSVTGSPAARF